MFLRGEDCEAVPLLLVFQTYFLHHRSTLWKAPSAPFLGFKLTSITRFGSGAKCSVGKSLGNSATRFSSTSHLMVNTHCNVYRLEGFSSLHSACRGCSWMSLSLWINLSIFLLTVHLIAPPSFRWASVTHYVLVICVIWMWPCVSPAPVMP